MPQATHQEIRLAYKAMTQKWHPDKNKDVDTTVQMQLILEAYSVLKNANKRKLYDTEYYKSRPLQKQNRQEREKRTEICYYCKKNIANIQFSPIKTFYKETGRSYFPKRKILYQTITISIPRCEKCYKIHNGGAFIFMILPIVSFALLGLILGLTIWSMWMLCILAGGFFGGIIGSFLSFLDKSIIAKESGVKMETDISDFDPIRTLFKNNWSCTKPSI